MDHADHVRLLREGVPHPGGRWADLGSGQGAFTLALAELVGPQGEIYSIDRDSRALQEQERRMNARFPEGRRPQVHYRAADFTRPLDLPPLEGVVMANSLHFQRDKEPVLRQVWQSLKPGGRLILVEYNVDRGNVWVPYPLSYPTWERLAGQVGFVETQRLASVPSHFLREIYSTLSFRPEVEV